MDRRDASAALLLASVGAMRIAAAGPAAAPVALPSPATSGGLPLRDALARRRSTREFATRPVPPPVLSNLLWAAVGVIARMAGARRRRGTGSRCPSCSS